MNQKSVDDVREFWENNPLWTGESSFEPGTREFFDEHRTVYIEDCFAGEFDKRFLPPSENREKVLDLGCGPGFWTVELFLRGCSDITAADLTKNALVLVKKRCEIYGVDANFSEQNAESTTFEDGVFSHVNCQGVIHHTPNTEACIQEIARVLRDGGSASISVYYRNIFLRCWPLIKWVGKIIQRLGGGLKGRGREGIYGINDSDEIVRLYDGEDNPIGKSYSKKQLINMLKQYFVVEETYLHFFPARSLPFRLPKFVVKFLDAKAGFMIYATVRKR